MLGQPLAYPLVLAPTGFTRIADPQGELAVARAAERAGLPYTLSTMSTRSIEEVRKVSGGLACSEDLAVITNNIKDFRPLAAQWLAQGRVHAGLILLPSSRTRTRAAITMLADRIASILRDNPAGLASSERWIGPLPKD